MVNLVCLYKPEDVWTSTIVRYSVYTYFYCYKCFPNYTFTKVVKDIVIRYSSSSAGVYLLILFAIQDVDFFFSLQNQGEEEKLNEWNTSLLRQIKETRNSLDINIFWSFFSNKRWIEKKLIFSYSVFLETVWKFLAFTSETSFTTKITSKMFQKWYSLWYSFCKAFRTKDLVYRTKRYKNCGFLDNFKLISSQGKKMNVLVDFVKDVLLKWDSLIYITSLQYTRRKKE